MSLEGAFHGPRGRMNVAFGCAHIKSISLITESGCHNNISQTKGNP
jgi:hypothetical protein